MGVCQSKEAAVAVIVQTPPPPVHEGKSSLTSAHAACLTLWPASKNQ